MPDQAYDGAKEFYFTDWYLQYAVRCGRWFPELHSAEVHVCPIKSFLAT